MDLSKFDYMWKLMAKGSLEFSAKSEHDDLRCVICNNVIVNAVFNNVCGCQYCYDCIDNYTSKEANYCPGRKDDCKDEKLVLGGNAVKNKILNKRVSKLVAKCPNKFCECYVELIEMEGHLRLCTKQPMECPYVAIGCTSERTNKDEISKHLNKDTMIHSTLLIELIINLKNEISELKDKFAKSYSEICSLQKQLIDKDDRIVKLEKENENNQMQKNLATEKLKMVVSDLKDVQDGFEKCKMEMSSLKEELIKKDTRIKDLEEISNVVKTRMKEEKGEKEKELKKQKLLIGDVNVKGDYMSTKESCARKDINKMWEGKNMDEIDKRSNSWPNIYADFVWKVEEVSKKIDKGIFSESFYSNDYKLCLSLYIYSCNNYIKLDCYVMKGDNDEILLWPLKRHVTLSIIDQHSLKTYESKTCQSTFERPTSDRGGGVGILSIKYASIKDKSSIVANDSILVSCVISDQ